MRRGIGHLLNRRVQVSRSERTPDGGGGTSTTWGVVADRVRCRISQPSPAERERGERSGAELTHNVYFLPGADVRRGDELSAADGRTFEVLAVFGPSVDIYVRADVREHQADGVPT